MDNIVELRNVSKTYGSKVKTQALSGIELAIPPQSFSAIIGESGSGKSTLLNIIGTLDRPTAGQVYIGGAHTEGMGKNELAALRNGTIGFVFQFHYLLPEFTAYENILLPQRIRHGAISEEAKARANALMRLMGIDGVKDNRANDMSGGQQQRTAIARALINQPKLVLADEPTGNLDTGSADAVYALMRDISERLETAFLIVTHDRAIAKKTDRIIEVQDGRIKRDMPHTAGQEIPQ